MRSAFAFFMAAVASLTPAFLFDKYAHNLPGFFASDFGSVIMFFMIIGMIVAGPVTYYLITRNR